MDLSLGVSASGTGPFNYAWTGTGVFNPDAASPNATVSGAATGMYLVVVSNACGSTSAAISVVVQSAPSATIAYAGSPYCASAGTANVTRTGSAGGTYGASPSGLSLNTNNGNINLAASTAGSYTVTYTVAASGGCSAFSTTAQVAVTEAPSASIAYSGTPYCSSAGTAIVTRAGTSGGTYGASPSGLALNTSNGNINLSASTVGSYTVTYTVAAAGGCSAFSTTAQVAVTAEPSASIAYSGTPYCSSAGTAIVTRAGTSGGTYGASPSGLSLNTNNGNINLVASTAGSYTVTYTVAAAGGCAAFSTSAPVTITAAASASIAYTGSPYCGTTGTAAVTRTGQSGGSYAAAPAGLVVHANTGAISLGNSNPGTYTVTYTLSAIGGCGPFTTTAMVVINAPSTWYADVDGDGAGDNAVTVQACSQPGGYVAVGGDLCPEDPNKVHPGVCGCGVPDTDSDQDGIADCMDSCPQLAGQVGDPCDDGDPNTENDVITADCTCAGIPTTVWEQKPGDGWRLWPNPARGQVFLQAPVSGPISLSVVDSEGRMVRQMNLSLAQGTVGWSTAQLARGAYAVRILSPHAVEVLRLVVE